MATAREMVSQSQTEQKLVAAAGLMDKALMQSTGLKERERRLVINWTLATHTLPHVHTFPLLPLVGKMGTGKSQAEKIIGRFAHRSRSFSLRGRTLPAIRDELAACYEGTAIIEEADHAWMFLASWFVLFRRFNLAHPGTLKVKRIEFRSAGA